MKSRVIGVTAGVVIAVLVVAALAYALGNHPTLYAGKLLADWRLQLDSPAPGASNRAVAVLNSQIIPGLTGTMFHDTRDSVVVPFLVNALNRLPGVRLNYYPAVDRRSTAARDLGNFGPAAAAAVPALIQAVQGPQTELHEPAVQSLGKIHCAPDEVIPLLISCLTNDDLNEDAAVALGIFGSRAKEAFPKLLPLLHNGDPHVRGAARYALGQIDPEAAVKAGAGPGRTGGR